MLNKLLSAQNLLYKKQPPLLCDSCESKLAPKSTLCNYQYQAWVHGHIGLQGWTPLAPCALEWFVNCRVCCVIQHPTTSRMDRELSSVIFARIFCLQTNRFVAKSLARFALWSVVRKCVVSARICSSYWLLTSIVQNDFLPHWPLG